MRLSVVVSLVLVFVLQTPLVAQEAGLAAATSLMSEQRWEAARAMLEELVASPDASSEAWFALGRCRHRLGELDAAIEAYERSAEADGNTAPRALFAAARAAAADGQDSLALDLFARTIEVGGTPYLPAQSAPEFADLRRSPRFQSLLERIKPCNATVYRQFDFWLGEWDVMVNDQRSAASRITREQGGCVVREDYATLAGFAGTSLSFHDATTGQWHQYWIDNLGQVLRLSGGLQGKRMMLTSAPGDSMSRMIWTPEGDGSVRQVAESSSDGGKSWSVSFDGLYVPRATGD